MSVRVVISGIGLCTPTGRGVTEVWDNLICGRSGIGVITLFDASSLPVRIGGEVKDLDLPNILCHFPDAVGESDRKVWLGLDAAWQAIMDARLESEHLPPAQIHVGVGLETLAFEQVTPIAQADDMAQALIRRMLEHEKGITLQTPLDRLTQLVGECFNIFNGRYTNCSACVAGAQAIGEAFHHIRFGTAELAIAGAADSVLNPLGLGGFSLLHILSAENDCPERACRPFEATRQGTVLSEGAAFLVLETLEHATQRGARVYAEISGYGASMDAYRVSDPEPTGRGAVLSMAKAMADAGLRPTDIACVNAHGTGTPKNDIAETLAIKRLLGAQAKRAPVPAIKSMTGHMIAASGAVEAAVSALSLFMRKIPPTINLIQPDPACDLDYVAEGCRDFDGHTVLSNSFGFGGQNASLILSRYEP
jgi:3-oxoacyl-[acyl-carrier-protein] synthase II